MRAILFPGQGSQYVGMASDFYKKFDSTKKTFEIVDETLGFSLTNIILDGPDEELKLTKNTTKNMIIIKFSLIMLINVFILVFNIIKKN